MGPLCGPKEENEMNRPSQRVEPSKGRKKEENWPDRQAHADICFERDAEEMEAADWVGTKMGEWKRVATMCCVWPELLSFLFFLFQFFNLIQPLIIFEQISDSFSYKMNTYLSRLYASF